MKTRRGINRSPWVPDSVPSVLSVVKQQPDSPEPVPWRVDGNGFTPSRHEPEE